jgi:hypothetical protein
LREGELIRSERQGVEMRSRCEGRFPIPLKAILPADEHGSVTAEAPAM